jgi:hypothetical protein
MKEKNENAERTSDIIPASVREKSLKWKNHFFASINNNIEGDTSWSDIY